MKKKYCFAESGGKVVCYARFTSIRRAVSWFIYFYDLGPDARFVQSGLEYASIYVDGDVSGLCSDYVVFGVD